MGPVGVHQGGTRETTARCGLTSATDACRTSARRVLAASVAAGVWYSTPTVPSSSPLNLLNQSVVSGEDVLGAFIGASIFDRPSALLADAIAAVVVVVVAAPG